MLLDIALDAYQNRLITTAELGEILNIPSRLQVREFLQKSGVYINYDQEALEQDLQVIKELRK
jgi:predicted HTH domain antitoxin